MAHRPRGPRMHGSNRDIVGEYWTDHLFEVNVLFEVHPLFHIFTESIDVSH